MVKKISTDFRDESFTLYNEKISGLKELCTDIIKEYENTKKIRNDLKERCLKSMEKILTAFYVENIYKKRRLHIGIFIPLTKSRYYNSRYFEKKYKMSFSGTRLALRILTSLNYLQIKSKSVFDLKNPENNKATVYKQSNKLSIKFSKYNIQITKNIKVFNTIIVRDSEKNDVTEIIDLNKIVWKQKTEITEKLNNHLEKFKIYMYEEKFDKYLYIKPEELYYHRVFNNCSSFRGGRFYSKIQNEKKEYRKNITIQKEPCVEIDFSSLHLSMIHALEDIILTKEQIDNLYEIDGLPLYERNHIKILINVLFNSKSLEEAVKASAYTFRKSKKNLRWARETKENTGFVKKYKKEKKELDELIERKNKLKSKLIEENIQNNDELIEEIIKNNDELKEINEDIKIKERKMNGYKFRIYNKDLSLSDSIKEAYDKIFKKYPFLENYITEIPYGLRLQNLDSKIMEGIINDCCEKKRNICIIPIHDSVIVRKKYQKIVEDIMISNYKKIFPNQKYVGLKSTDYIVPLTNKDKEDEKQLRDAFGINIDLSSYTYNGHYGQQSKDEETHINILDFDKSNTSEDSNKEYEEEFMDYEQQQWKDEVESMKMFGLLQYEIEEVYIPETGERKVYYYDDLSERTVLINHFH